MKRSWFSEEQIIAILREQKAGVPAVDRSRKDVRCRASTRRVRPASMVKVFGCRPAEAERLG